LCTGFLSKAPKPEQLLAGFFIKFLTKKVIFFEAEPVEEFSKPIDRNS